MGLLKVFLALIQIVGSIILFIMGKGIIETLYRALQPGDPNFVRGFIVIIAIIFGGFFLIGLYFFLDAINKLEQKDIALLKSKKIWITILILVVLLLLYYFFVMLPKRFVPVSPGL